MKTASSSSIHKSYSSPTIIVIAFTAALMLILLMVNILFSPTVPGTEASTTGTIYPIADAYVKSSQTTNNYGTSTDLDVKNDPANTKISYLTFDISPYSGKTILSAVLRIKTRDVSYAGSAEAQNIWNVSDTSWSETQITYAARPTISNVKLGQISNTAPSTSYDIPLNVSTFRSLMKTNPSRISMAFIGSANSNGIYFYSKEGAVKPQLIITYDNVTPTPTPVSQTCTISINAIQSIQTNSTSTVTAVLTPKTGYSAYSVSYLIDSQTPGTVALTGSPYISTTSPYTMTLSAGSVAGTARITARGIVTNSTGAQVFCDAAPVTITIAVPPTPTPTKTPTPTATKTPTATPTKTPTPTPTGAACTITITNSPSMPANGTSSVTSLLSPKTGYSATSVSYVIDSQTPASVVLTGSPYVATTAPYTMTLTAGPVNGTARITARGTVTNNATGSQVFCDATPAAIIITYPTTPTPSKTPTPTPSSGGGFGGITLGQVVSGTIYVTLYSDPNVTDYIRFSIDNIFINEEHDAPYSLGGDTNGVINGYNTRQLTNGQHVLKAEVYFKDGTVQLYSVTFTVNNPTPTPTQMTGTVVPTAIPTKTPTPSTLPTTIPPTTVVCPLKPQGDANCDNKVDMIDYEIWRQDFVNQTSGDADFDKNGQTDLIDYETWRQGFVAHLLP